MLQSGRGINSIQSPFCDFDHLAEEIGFLLDGILFGLSRESFSKKNCPKRTFRSDLVKLGSKILYLFLAEKWSFVCCNTFLIVAP